MLACFRQGFVVLPCTEQLRPQGSRSCGWPSRSRGSWSPTRRNEATLQEAGWTGDTLWVPFDRTASHTPAARRARARRPVPDHVHLRHVRRAEGGRCTASATCPASSCRPSTGWRPQPGELVWCTAAAGWSKSARNAFIAPWLRGAAALLHDARFDPHERLELIARERVDVLCMAPTEYRVIAKRATLRPLPRLKGVVAAGEALNPEVLHAWHEATGLWIRDGYGQTETGQLTGAPLGETPRPGSMGRPLPGVELRRSSTASWCSTTRRPTRRSSCATSATEPHEGPWHTGDRVARRRGRLPVLRGPHRRRDHLRRLPDRPVRGRVRARRPRGRGRGGGRRRARRRARLDRPRRRRPARRLRAVRRARRASSRTTSRPRPRRTSTRASSTSSTSCPRPPRARSAERRCASSVRSSAGTALDPGSRRARGRPRSRSPASSAARTADDRGASGRAPARAPARRRRATGRAARAGPARRRAARARPAARSARRSVGERVEHDRRSGPGSRGRRAAPGRAR